MAVKMEREREREWLGISQVNRVANMFGVWYAEKGCSGTVCNIDTDLNPYPDSKANPNGNHSYNTDHSFLL